LTKKTYRGIAPRKRPTTNQLDESEMKELLKRGQSERDEMSGDRIEGLGAAPYVILCILIYTSSIPRRLFNVYHL
jgi:hypothetical protein